MVAVYTELEYFILPGIRHEWQDSSVKEHEAENQKPESGRQVLDI